MTNKTRAYDIRSAEPVLFYVGPPVADIPDTDLSANALGRIAFIRGGTDKDIAALVDALAATGSYSKEPATPATEEPS
jgi:hypothetical protein